MEQERKKRRIVLASVLKPVDDTRMFEKMATSLAQSGKYDVTIVGFPSSSLLITRDVDFISLKPFNRLSISRMLAKWRVFNKVRKLKPSILIFNTHELIIPSIVLKVISDVKIVYDVRENYWRNILYSKSFPSIFRWPLAFAVRFKEKLLAPAIDHFFLSEKGYDDEFKFHRGGYSIIENKSGQHPGKRIPAPGKIRLLFSGTLAESTGVFRAIALAKGLKQLDSSVQLSIVGFAALKITLDHIKHEIKGHSWITLTGGSELVPHPLILEAIRNSDAGFLAYTIDHHTRNSRPTKLFEYLHGELPIILESHWPWITEFNAINPFLLVNFDQPDYPAILKALRSAAFYREPPKLSITWASEEPGFLEAVDAL